MLKKTLKYAFFLGLFNLTNYDTCNASTQSFSCPVNYKEVVTYGGLTFKGEEYNKLIEAELVSTHTRNFRCMYQSPGVPPTFLEATIPSNVAIDTCKFPNTTKQCAAKKGENCVLTCQTGTGSSHQK